MSDEIYRLVYYSHNLIAGAQDEFAENVADILAKSRANNLRDRITGALLFNAGCFAQVLEGPLETVEGTFERIQQDARHSDVSLLALEPVEQRSFPNWAMGFVGLSAENAKRFAGVGQTSGFDPARLSGDEIHRILKDLTLQEEVIAA